MAQASRFIGAGALLFGSVTLALPSQAQPIYRCANSYSQTPCPDGIRIDVDDSRSPTQKAQSDAGTAQAVRLANEMEQSRLKAEQAAGNKTGSPAANTKPLAAKSPTSKPGRRQKVAQPNPFVAFAPPQEKPETKKPAGATTKP